MSIQKLTLAEAKEQGYTHYGFSGLDWQGLNSIDDYRQYEACGNEVLFSKEYAVPSIDVDTIKELIGVHLYSQWSDETGDDDAIALSREVKEMDDSVFSLVEAAVNAEMAKYHKSYTLTDIQLIP